MRQALVVAVGFAMLLAVEASAKTPEEWAKEAPAAKGPRLTATAEDVDFSAPWSVEETRSEIQAEETGYERYHLWRLDDGFVRYATPSGTEASLQVTACAQDVWCCTGGYEICYYNYSSSEDDELQVTLSGAPSFACTLLHYEDDVARKQYASHEYQEQLKQEGMLCSMSRKGDCWDNSVVESFFGTLKDDLIHRHPWPTKGRAIEAINEYIACFYNGQRRHKYLDNISPVEYERQAT